MEHVEGYEIGPIKCKAAFMADFDVAVVIPIPQSCHSLLCAAHP